MTDRELIELAAKAAGIIVWRGNGFQDDTYFTDAKTESGVVVGAEWNPITRDADAFRLAVKLGLMMEWCRIDSYTMDGQGYGVVLQWPPGGIKNRIISEVSEFQADPYAATRRAITMAAAEIAKERPK